MFSFIVYKLTLLAKKQFLLYNNYFKFFAILYYFTGLGQPLQRNDIGNVSVSGST